MSSSSINLRFDNRNLRSLPVDKETKNYCREVPHAIFSRVDPTPVENPKLVAYSRSALSLLGITEVPNEDVVTQYFSGNNLFEGSDPAAHCYSGHQFGSFASQLGDGAAISLGEVVNPQTGQRWEVQLKGAGKTPYSRHADGRKVLRSSVREFLCSEAMAALGVPTTRAATCVTSDSTVERDPFYDGRSVLERCTVVSRLAENFFRFGSFEIFRPGGPSAGDEQLRRQFFEFLQHSAFPEIAGLSLPEEERAALVFAEVVRRTARLAARWQAVGFVHGVLNTDNLSALGLTLDYGPFGFLEYFDGQFVPNGSDHSGRYAYERQPAVCRWNLEKLAEALGPLLPADRAAAELGRYDELFRAEHLRLFREKCGVSAAGREGEDDAADEEFFEELRRVMTATFADFSDSFVAVSEFFEVVLSHDQLATLAAGNWADDPANPLTALLDKLVVRCAPPVSVEQLMRRKLKVHRLEMHPTQIEQLGALLAQAPPAQLREVFGPSAPLDAIREEVAGEQRKLSALTGAADWLQRLKSMTRAGKQAEDRGRWAAFLENFFLPRVLREPRETFDDAVARGLRLERLRRANPTLVLRGWMAQHAIERAELGDFSAVRELLRLLEEPCDPAHSFFRRHPVSPTSASEFPEATSCPVAAASPREFFLSAAPDWADSLLCTCSS
jgi:uncharacterized protein YdiU (UPF0061 family)